MKVVTGKAKHEMKRANTIRKYVNEKNNLKTFLKQVFL